ncbi:hypothetical protein ES702_07041 [subsurface metagenome]
MLCWHNEFADSHYFSSEIRSGGHVDPEIMLSACSVTKDNVVEIECAKEMRKLHFAAIYYSVNTFDEFSGLNRFSNWVACRMYEITLREIQAEGRAPWGLQMQNTITMRSIG